MNKTDLKPTDTHYATDIQEKNVEQIYIGGDECCRCGCMGKYYEDPKNIRRLLKLTKKKIEQGEVSMDTHPEDDNFASYINFSYPSNNDIGRAITIYFKKST